MMILAFLPIAVFSLLWMFLVGQIPPAEFKNDKPLETFILAGLIWSAYLALGTELLSLFRGLTTIGVVLLWFLAVLVLGYVHWRHNTLRAGWMNLKQTVSSLRPSILDAAIIVAITVALAIILITALMAPPNIHDVLTYHMSRVMQWVQNQTLAFFPTAITWQLYYPPFSEFSQLHWQLLAGNDTLSAFHQWYSLVFILVIVVAMTNRMGANRRGQLIGALFMASLPIAVLQASSGKNDIVLTSFFLALAFFAVKSVYQPLVLIDWICAGLAFGLGVMTKGHFVFFSLPLLAWLLITMLRKTGWKPTLYFTGIGVLTTFILNGNHWVRNILTFGDPTNSSEAGFIINGRMGWDVLISNLSRNIALQLSSVGIINRIVERWLTELHVWLGIPLFDTATTLGPKQFLSMPTREEIAGNPIHFGITVLILIGILIKAFNRKNHPEILPPLMLSLSAITGLILFSAIFRWQAWGTRYFIFYYALFAPVVGYLLGILPLRWLHGLVGFVLIVTMLNPLLNNYSRAFSWSENNRNSIWRMSRRGLRFANHQIYEGAILDMTYLMDISGCRTYGMSIGGNSPEYLIWGTLTPDSRAYYLEHVAVDNASAMHATEYFDPCGIIVLEAAPPELAFLGDYRLVRGWRLEGYEGFPLTLFLKPAEIPQGLE